MSAKEFNRIKKGLRRLLDEFIEAFRSYMNLKEIKRMVEAAVKAYKAAVLRTDLIYYGLIRLN